MHPCIDASRDGEARALRERQANLCDLTGRLAWPPHYLWKLRARRARVEAREVLQDLHTVWRRSRSTVVRPRDARVLQAAERFRGISGCERTARNALEKRGAHRFGFAALAMRAAAAGRAARVPPPACAARARQAPRAAALRGPRRAAAPQRPPSPSLQRVRSSDRVREPRASCGETRPPPPPPPTPACTPAQRTSAVVVRRGQPAPGSARTLPGLSLRKTRSLMRTNPLFSRSKKLLRTVSIPHSAVGGRRERSRSLKLKAPF